MNLLAHCINNFRRLKLILISVSFASTCLINTSVYSEDLGRVTLELSKQIHMLDQIALYTESQHLARIGMIRTATEKLMVKIKQTNADGHADVFFAKQHYAITYKYSRSFFSNIASTHTSPMIEKTQLIADSIITHAGLDKIPYSNITASTFEQIHKLLNQIIDMQPQGSPVLALLQDVSVDVGVAYAYGTQGDRLRSLLAAIPAYTSIRNSYDELAGLNLSPRGQEILNELQELTEFYGEFSQINSISSKDALAISKILKSNEVQP